ncbi:Planctomycete cytochrome C [Maioricimonas rarisocia]|uniref:Planctomycete cytochrome C n=1 Tax=Maioricimonas rarisocia TaxID=2528026 RepID=A0A517Z0K7_9PLAN|nr:PSD1 and planctomycete cytochrome C domain-containing protein [Maioricimonas rarisocia]QDU36021.1 Planctomycete cytochrome C [Maioricimonas rarisocia]
MTRLLLTLVLAVLAGPAAAADSIEFNRDIRPILSDRCFACHGPDAATREADLRLDVREAALKDRGGYHAIAPGDLDASEVVARITSDGDDRMPPPDHAKPLSEDEKQLLTRWIEQGAEYQEHWSLVPLSRPEVPDVANREWVRTPVDAFILQGLEEEGLAPSPPADPRTLVRRLSFDLTGLPPDPALVESFRETPSRKTWEQLVEERLASPHYGERMAIYWLDLVRYADTLGYHGDQVRSVSPYRDYVIRAFNENKPFDEFTIEQLAGDLLPDATLSQKVASTYNRLNRASGEGGVQPKEYLAKYSADRVRTTGSVWLGMTFGCAECHDHKFDPFTAKDFYSFAAFFADIRELGIVRGANHIEQLPVPTEEQAAQLQQLTREIAAARSEYERTSPELTAAFESWQQEVLRQAELWQPLQVTEAASEGGAKLTVQEDGSVLASGRNPDKDVYTLHANIDLPAIAGLRLELLPDKSLPAKGPGRASNGNLVIHVVEAVVAEESVPWESATATHSQNNHSPEHIINGHRNGWAILPQTGQSHHLVLVAKDPVALSGEGPKTIEVRIRQNHGNGHNVGRFRLHAASTPGAGTGNEFASPEVMVLLQTPAEKRTDDQRKQLDNAFRAQTPLLADVRERLGRLESAKDRLEKSIVTTLATKATEPRMIRVLPRGNWMDDSGEVVEPAVPHFLPQPSQKNGRLNRLDLALWMTSRDNPLVARTFVNRLWMLFFGHGLCRTVDDLGSQGEWPTHSELLDWLAVEFIDSGWDVKHIVRLMLLSNTWQQSSNANDELRSRDPFNRLYARQSRWRLDAEMVRDNALAVSGLLVDDIGGSSAKPYQPAGYWAQLNFPKRTYQHDKGANQYRRGLYTHWQRTFLHPSLLAFDAPAREECTARRDRSNTPLQALVLLNDPTYVEAARVLAGNVIREGGNTTADRLDWLYRRVLARAPSDFERALLTDLFDENLANYRSSPKAADSLLETGLAPRRETIDAAEAAAWTAVTRAVLNLHETIMRY